MVTSINTVPIYTCGWDIVKLVEGRYTLVREEIYVPILT